MRFAAVSALLLCGALASVAVPLPVLATTTIQGHMTDTDTGGPAAGVVIKVCAASGCAGSVGQTDSNGNYEIDNAPPGGAWSLVTFPTDACTAGEYARAHENVTIPPDGVLNPPDITVTRQKATIEGVVRDSQNRPAAGVNVTAENSEQGGDGFNYANTGADGSYAIPCLPIGRGYFLTANPPRTAGLGQQMDSPFTLTAGQVLQHDINLSSATGSINGTVTCGGSACQVGLLVGKVCDGPGGSTNGCSVASIQSDGAGLWVAPNLTAGSYIAHAFGPFGWDSAARYDIQVGDGQAVSGVSITLVANGQATSGKIVGTVTDAVGKGVPSCKLNVFNTLPPPPPLAQGFATAITTDQAGAYDTGWILTPGSLYRVYADCPGQNEVSKDKDLGGKNVVVAAGTSETVNLSLAMAVSGSPSPGASASAPPSSSPKTAAPATGTGLPPWVWAVVVIILLLGVGFGVWLRARFKAAAPAPTLIADDPQPDSNENLTIEPPVD